MTNRRSFIKFILLCIVICISFTSCGGASDEYTAGKPVETKNAGASFHTFSGKTQTVAKNDFIELCVDKNNHSVLIKDLKENYTWHTLSEKPGNYAYAFGVTLYTEKGIYNLNTQDNSVAFKTSSYEIKDNVLTVKYVLSDNAETAKKNIQDMTEDDIFVSFNAVYTILEQSVYLDIDVSKMNCTENGFVSEISVMPFLGASAKDGKDDYFFIPDNSGAIMHLDKKDALTDNITVNVYGENPYNPNEQNAASAYIPVFGVKRNSSAFAAVITDADALAVINASRQTGNIPSNISSVFTITEVKTVSENEKTNSVLKGASYNGKISIAYKFLSGSRAGYSAMASAAKEEFIAKSYLPSTLTADSDNIPFCLTIVGSADNEVLTTTQQTTDILSILKGKGINNINLTYKGLFSGGFAQKNLYTANIKNNLGGKDGLSDLYGYTKTQNCALLPGVNIFSSSSGYSAINKSLTVAEKDAVFSMSNDMGFNENAGSGMLSRIGNETMQMGKEKMNPSLYAETAQYSMNLMNLKKMHDKFQTYLQTGIFDYSDGISVTDAGKVLYSDGKTDRQTAMNTVSSLLRAVSNYGKLGIEGGNIYTLYDAQLVSGLTFDTHYPESENYEAVPFMQAVLHGNIIYTGKPIDAGNPLYRYEMLRYIEYGAAPSYEWIYKDVNVYCYNGYLLSERISEIVDFYNDANNTLAELSDKAIVNHRKITKNADGKSVSGVYCTTYSDGTEIYVNYTGSLVLTTDNIAVGPYNYVKVNR